jgi:hypothetical protein
LVPSKPFLNQLHMRLPDVHPTSFVEPLNTGAEPDDDRRIPTQAGHHTHSRLGRRGMLRLSEEGKPTRLTRSALTPLRRTAKTHSQRSLSATPDGNLILARCYSMLRCCTPCYYTNQLFWTHLVVICEAQKPRTVSASQH